LYPPGRLTLRRALEQRLGSRLTYVPGANVDAPLDIQAAASAANAADVVVLCLGEMSYAETPGNIDDLSLPHAQLRLADAVLAAGKPVVLVMIEGRPRIIRTIADKVAGTLIALNPGSEGGVAIADVLLGEVNPSGRLPITYPRQPNSLMTYDHKAIEDADASFGQKAFQPQFEFGSGLSYTTFEYSGLTAPPTATFLRGIDVSLTVRNTGKRAGTEVVQLYVSDRVASVPPPGKRLKRFVRVDLAPGASRQVAFHLTRDDLSFFGPRGRVAEPGAFTLSAGGLTRDVVVK
jgi:beta-glucosidase